MDLKHRIESILFVSNKPLGAKNLAKFLEVSEEEILQAARDLAADRMNSGVVVLEANNSFQLATHNENSELVKNFLNSDLREKLTEATVEVLSIIAYRQPISKAELEAIRGVNSQYSIRALLMRGLIEKVPNPNDARGSLYQVTTEFLQHLGITRIEDLPDFETITAQIKLPDTPQAKPEPTAEGDAETPSTGDPSVSEQESEQETIQPTETIIKETIITTTPVSLAISESPAAEKDDFEEELEDDEDEDDDDEEDED